MLSNQQVAQVFENIADAMELLGEDRYKFQAYRRASEMIAALPRSLHDYHARGTLEDIPGVGPAISGKIGELLDTGSLQFYERLRAKVPDGVLDVMRVPGVGPKTAWRLYQELGIDGLESLEAAASAGRIRTLKGLGARLEERILAGLRRQATESERFLLGDALPLAREIRAAYRTAEPPPVDVRHPGSLRRACPTARALDFVGLTLVPPAALDAFAALPPVATVDCLD